MRRGRRVFAAVKPFRTLFDFPVRQSNPLVLPQVLCPILDQEAFDMSAWRRRILKNAPSDRSIAQANPSEITHRRREFRALFRINVILGHHHHRSTLGMGWRFEYWLGPVAGMCDIAFLTEPNGKALHN